MSRHWLWWLAGATLLALALAWQAPAWLAADLVARQSQGRLQLEKPEGTIWSGRGRLIIQTPKGSQPLVEALAWRVDPLALLAARLALTLEAGAQPAGELFLWREGLEVQDLKLKLPANALAALPQLQRAQPTGSLRVDIPALRWAERDSHGAGRVIWQEAGLQLAGSVARWRGEVVVEISARENLLSLHTAAGSPVPLRLELQRGERGISAQLAAPAP